RHEERERALLRHEVAERRGGRRDDLRHLRVVGGNVELDGAHQERDPGEDQQPQERALLQHVPDAGPRDDGPGAARRLAMALVAAIRLIVNRAHASPIALAKTSSRVGRLGRRCRTCTPCATASWNTRAASPAAWSAGTKTRMTSSSVS